MNDEYKETSLKPLDEDAQPLNLKTQQLVYEAYEQVFIPLLKKQIILSKRVNEIEISLKQKYSEHNRNLTNEKNQAKQKLDNEKYQAQSYLNSQISKFQSTLDQIRRDVEYKETSCKSILDDVNKHVDSQPLSSYISRSNNPYIKQLKSFQVSESASVLLTKANKSLEVLRDKNTKISFGCLVWVAWVILWVPVAQFFFSSGFGAATSLVVSALSLLGIYVGVAGFYKVTVLRNQATLVTSIVEETQEALRHELDKAKEEYKNNTQQEETTFKLTMEKLNSKQMEEEKAFQWRSAKLSEEYEKEVEQAINSYKNDLEDFKQTLLPKIKGFQEKTFNFGAYRYRANWDNESFWKNWQPPSNFCKFSVYVGHLVLGTFSSKDFLLLPAFIPAYEKGIIFTVTKEHRIAAINSIKSIILRLLTTFPPGQIYFTFIDPIDLGQNVAEFMMLSDYEDKLVGGKAWSDPQHIEKKFVELTEHIETVTQKYLRGDFTNIELYNEQASVREPYRVLVIFDFPANIKEDSAQRLLGIIRNGPRCGVHTFIVTDETLPKNYRLNLADLNLNRISYTTLIDQLEVQAQSDSLLKQERLTNIKDIVPASDSLVTEIYDNNIENHLFPMSLISTQLRVESERFRNFHLELDSFPSNEFADGGFAKKILQTIGEQAKEGMKVEVPFDQLLKWAEVNELWKCNSTKNLQVPLGPAGAKKIQQLIFGEGTSHHGLILGRPGSGKTNLMHVIITSLSLMYPPEELKLYLIDFKKGVGFKPYADFVLPHAVAIAIESEREFGLSVLEKIDAEMNRLGEVFRKETCEDIKEYRKKAPDKKLGRTLLVVDEFQEFFTQDDNISKKATLLLDRIVRQGRAFGIHILLGTQTLHSSYSLARGTIDQMAVRIALQCSDADSRIILASDNPAARLLSRPGEAIYNAANGLVEGNNPFQVALFTDEDRNKWLRQISTMAKGNYTDVIVFEGNEPAKLEKCKKLREFIHNSVYPAKTKATYAWVGEPTSIRDEVSVRFRRQGGSNLLALLREESEGVGVMTAALLSLVNQHKPNDAKFFILNIATAEEPWEELADKLADMLPHQIKVVKRRGTVELIKDLWDEVKRRITEPESPSITNYLFIIGLHRARELRQDAEPIDRVRYSELFGSLLREGPEAGLHVLAWCDSYANLSRVISSKQMNEFALRIAGPMNDGDSSKFIDDTAAAKLDKPHRAIFYDDERPGYLEKFRPYGIPEESWLSNVTKQLSGRNN